MAKLSPQDILQLARLSKLRLSDEEVNLFGSELEAILNYVEQLSNVDTSELEPTVQVTNLQNVMREDEVADYQATPEQLLKNVPQTKDNYIKVKRIIE